LFSTLKFQKFETDLKCDKILTMMLQFFPDLTNHFFAIFCICANHRDFNHRYLKKSRLLKFCYVPASSDASSKVTFAAAINSANQTSKEGGICH
jgi:hypothetical protein